MLALGSAGTIEVFVSSPILDETEAVLLRKFLWAPSRVRDAIRAIRSFVVLGAVAATADVIVTGDLHLRQLRRFRGILIASPREFLDSQPQRQL